jgi:hypothetical protein
VGKIQYLTAYDDDGAEEGDHTFHMEEPWVVGTSVDLVDLLLLLPLMKQIDVADCSVASEQTGCDVVDSCSCCFDPLESSENEPLGPEMQSAQVAEQVELQQQQQQQRRHLNEQQLAIDLE